MKKSMNIWLLLGLGGLVAFMVVRQKKTPILNHVALSVANLKSSTAFYKDVLGLEQIDEPFKDGKHTWFRIAPHSQLHLIEAAKETVRHDKSTHLCFSVPSLEDFMARLDSHRISYGNFAGTSKSPQVRADGVRQIYLQDVDGYWLEINDDKY